MPRQTLREASQESDLGGLADSCNSVDLGDEMASYVYLIWLEGTSCYKVGKADNPAKRLKDLQTGHAGKLHLLTQMACKDALRKESYLHQKYGQWRVQGEWFSVPPTEIQELFAEFKFHVEATPDTPIYYWFSQAKAWKETALMGKATIEGAASASHDFMIYIDSLHDSCHSVIVSMLHELPPDLVAPYADRLVSSEAETTLLAQQVGIIRG